MEIVENFSPANLGRARMLRMVERLNAGRPIALLVLPPFCIDFVQALVSDHREESENWRFAWVIFGRPFPNPDPQRIEQLVEIFNAAAPA